MRNIENIVERYLELFPEDRQDLSILIEQLEESKDIFDRKNFKGHIVVNTLILNSRNEVLTIFHNKLKMYIQPGGHVDAKDKSVLEAAIRELQEEIGISNVVLNKWHKDTGVPIFIESHLIPENKKKNEEEHYHHDFMYIFKTDSDNVDLQLDEASDFQWIHINEVLEKNPESFIGKSLKRMFELGIYKIKNVR